MAGAQVTLAALATAALLANAVTAKRPEITAAELLGRSSIKKADLEYLRLLVQTQLGETPPRERRLVLALLIVESANRGPWVRVLEGVIARAGSRSGLLPERVSRLSLGVGQIQLRRAAVLVTGRDWRTLSADSRSIVISELLDDRAAVRMLLRIVREEGEKPATRSSAGGILGIAEGYHGDHKGEAAYSQVVSWLSDHLDDRLGLKPR